MLTEKLLQTTQKIKILGSESRVNKKWQTVAIILELFTLIWRPGDMVENLGLPDYPGELTALRFYRITIIIINYQSKSST